MKMDKEQRRQLYVWVYDQLKENPTVFGGDLGNRMIMSEYIKTHYADETVLSLPPMVLSICSTVSRIKNLLLIANPQFDKRTKHKPKKVA